MNKITRLSRREREDLSLAKKFSALTAGSPADTHGIITAYCRKSCEYTFCLRCCLV